MRVEIEHARREIVGSVRHRLRRPAHDRRGAAQDQRRRRADAQPLSSHALAGGEGRDGAVEPAGIGAARALVAAFQQILTIEMRALAVGGRGRMDDRGLLLPVEPRKGLHRRMKREEAVERQRGEAALRGDRNLAAKVAVGGIGNRWDRRQAIERAAQDHHQEPRVARASGAGGAVEMGPCVKADARAEQAAPRDRPGVAAAGGVGSVHAHQGLLTAAGTPAPSSAWRVPAVSIPPAGSPAPSRSRAPCRTAARRAPTG